MRKKFLLTMVVAGIAMLTVSCQKEELGTDMGKECISVAQAKAAFENELINSGENGEDLLGLSASVASKADQYAITYDLSPGEYTPEWDKAHSNPKGKEAAVSTTIIPEYGYVAVREYAHNDSVYSRTAVITYQKLITLSSPNGQIRNYIATIVPTEEYFTNNQSIDQIFMYGDKVDAFSGLVFLHVLDGAFYEVQKYANGKIVQRLNISSMDDAGDFIDKLNSVTGSINFGKFAARNAYTKANWFDDQEGLLAYWTVNTLSSSQARSISRCVANGYGNTCDVRQFYSQPYSAGQRNFSVTNNNYTYRVNDMTVGARPGVISTTISGSSKFTNGDGIPCTTLIWGSPDNLNSQVTMTLPNSDLDNFYNASGYTNGMNPPK